MANLRQLIYDCITVLSRGKYTDDSRLDDDKDGFLAYKIREKRAQEIRSSYDKIKMIDPVWLQDYGIVNVTEVNTADDVTATLCNCKLGKITLPRVISLTGNQSQAPDLGVYSVRSSCGTHEYYYKALPQLQYFIDDDVRSHFKYYSRVMDSLYIKPYAKQVRPMLILENPLDGYVNDTENKASGNLVVGTSYTVYGAQVVHNGIGYAPAATFTAVNTLFTGNGQVRLTTPRRQMTDLDPYPIGQDMADRIVLRILTEDCQIEKSQIASGENKSDDVAGTKLQ
jgi:hypothetical protein